jgi:alcohol dehydrogenase YqhD (iron-dependent ADH family)
VTDFGGIMPNPTLKKVQEGQQLARETKADLILAVGGGSVSDCCKIVAMGDTPIPLGVVVTASGTGSEQNNGAVITDEEKKVKGAMWGAFADFAILDPDLTKTVPMKQVISGAFDTLSHCMETYFGHPHTCNLSDRINEAVQRSVIKNLKALIARSAQGDACLSKNPDDDFARSELMWASAMGENGILKLGKVTDFQCHMIEHQLGAYTDCNHGQGLAVLHPVLYRHIYKSAEEKFRRWAQEVWLVQDADEGIDFLADFIREVGLPTTFTEMGIILDDDTIRAIADSTIITPGCCRQLTPNEIVEILKECK